MWSVCDGAFISPSSQVASANVLLINVAVFLVVLVTETCFSSFLFLMSLAQLILGKQKQFTELSLLLRTNLVEFDQCEFSSRSMKRTRVFVGKIDS